MNQTCKQSNLQKQKISFISINEKQFHLKLQENKYSKALKPIFLQAKSSSLKNLDLDTSSKQSKNQSSDSQMNESFEDNKSCCCLDCGTVGKKVKHLQKKFIIFTTKMSVLKKQRLSKRFQNAVFCIMYLQVKWKKIRQQERAKKLYRFKTKVFENQPFFFGQQHLNVNHITYNNSQIPNEEKGNLNQQVQSIQAQIIDQKHKQRNSVRLYLQKKLNNKTESSGILPTIAYAKYQISLTNQILKPIKTQKTLGDEQKSSKKEYNLLNYNSSMINSPYLNQFNGLKPQEQCLSQLKSPRSIIKSIQSETFFPYKQNISKFRKNLIKR
ncbi:unnamed protein product [Paramecium sonneborni]|uniref:Uncharacterized protein n=1 Tax=Paramecium sonneborni TaxID=65129 RepID=A0A8S1M942_9CILI|nr:unnamed protein product [Paramecium sonneborni]